MNNHTVRRFVGSLSLATLLLLPMAPASAAGTNIPALDTTVLKPYAVTDLKGHWAEETLSNFVQSGIINGYAEANGTVTVKPQNPITRAEFVKILVESLHLESNANAKSFSDVRQGEWYYQYVRAASSLGLVNGVSDTEFAPAKEITRGEIAALIVRAFEKTVPFEGTPKEFSDVNNYWGKSYVEAASQAGIVNGDVSGTTFRPNDLSTRAEAMVMLERALQKENTDLPADTALTQIVIDQDKAAYDAVYSATAAEDYSKIKDVIAPYSTGFYKVINDFYADLLTEFVKDGMKFEYKHEGDWTAEVVRKSNRYAAVQLHGGTYTVTAAKDNVSHTETMEFNELLYLKKMTDGSWKIYGGKLQSLVPASEGGTSVGAASAGTN